MTKTEMNEFIEIMGEIGDVWEVEDVERVYGDKSLEDALNARKTSIGMLFNNIGILLKS